MSKIDKIIYVDDEEINIQLFEIIMSENFDVFTSLSGFEGLEILDKHKDIKVVLSDLKMPGMNGLEFIKKAKEKYNHIKFFILTGFDLTDEIQQAIDTNLIVNYYRKPFSMEEIQAAINNVVKNT